MTATERDINYAKAHPSNITHYYSSLSPSRGSKLKNELLWSGDSSVGIETGYDLDHQGSFAEKQEFSPQLPYRLWDPPRLLSNGYEWWAISQGVGGKAAGASS
jgi:hypothetical protein